MIQRSNLHCVMPSLNQSLFPPFSLPSSLFLPRLSVYPKNSIKMSSNSKPRTYKLLKTPNSSSVSSSITTPSRDKIVDFGKYKGRMLGSLPSTYLKWVSKNLRAGDYEEWARFSDEVLEDPIYKDRIEWEFAEKILNGDVLRSKYENGSTVDELLELSERFGWDNEDKLGWSKINFGLLGTSKGGRIPRLGVESKGRIVEKLDLALSQSMIQERIPRQPTTRGAFKQRGKKNSTNGKKDYDGDEGVERRRARRERLKLRTKKTENDSNGGGTLGTSDEKVIDSAEKMSAMTMSGSRPFPGRQSLLKKAVSHKRKIVR